MGGGGGKNFTEKVQNISHPPIPARSLVDCKDAQ